MYEHRSCANYAAMTITDMLRGLLFMDPPAAPDTQAFNRAHFARVQMSKTLVFVGPNAYAASPQ